MAVRLGDPGAVRVLRSVALYLVGIINRASLRCVDANRLGDLIVFLDTLGSVS